jgi:hypothetical protein
MQGLNGVLKTLLSDCPRGVHRICLYGFHDVGDIMTIYPFLVGRYTALRLLVVPWREYIFRVDANSPSLWPIISSVIVTGIYSRPLCTRNFRLSFSLP